MRSAIIKAKFTVGVVTVKVPGEVSPEQAKQILDSIAKAIDDPEYGNAALVDTDKNEISISDPQQSIDI